MIQQHALDRTAGLIRFVFRSPEPWVTTLASLLLSFTVGILVFAELNFGPIIMYYVVVLFLIPTLGSAIVSKPLAELLKGKLYFRRSFLLSFIALVVVAAITVGVGGLTNSLLLGLLAGYSSVIWLRHLVLLGTSNSSHLLSLPASSSQTLLGFLGIWIMFPVGAQDFILALALVAIFFLSSVFFVEVAKIPIKKNLGLNGLKLLKAAISHFTSGSLELENFFATAKEEVDIELRVLCFKAAEKIKALVILPGVHPGPFGKLGGSNLPAKLVKLLDYPIFVFHSCSNHDYNPVASKECLKLVNKIKEVVPRMAQYSSFGSKCVSLSSKTISVSAQYLGNSLLLICSSHLPVDDLDFELAREVNSRLKAKNYATQLLFVDAHSCLERGAKSLELDSAQAQDIIKLSEEACSEARDSKVSQLHAGIAGRKLRAPDLGELGVQALVIEAHKQRVAYLLFDGNGMLPEIRNKIKSSLRDVVEHVEVLTTDNHAVNITMHGFNPVSSDYSALAKELVHSALANLEAIEVCGTTEKVKINIAGRGSTLKLTSAVSATLSLLKALFPITICITILACILAFLWIY